MRNIWGCLRWWEGEKKASFSYIKERVWRKLQGWEGKLLSQAGREVLIKAIVQAIPTYTMRCFKIPLGLCHDIEAMVKIFFGGSGVTKGKYIRLNGRS